MTRPNRFPPLNPDEMTDEQRGVAERIAAGPRKGLGGPFQAWLRSPVFADRMQLVGEHLRFNSSLPGRLNEFAILITARRWTAQYEWYAHHRMAMQAGLRPEIAADLAEGRRPDGMQPDEALIYEFCTELRRESRVSDATFEATREAFGDQGVIDLIAVMGYYDAVSMTLNVAEVPLPDGVEPPLRPLA